MSAGTRELRGNTIYLEHLDQKHREILRPLAKDERIWEFTKTLSLNETYDDQFDLYFEEALRNNETGGQSFVIRLTEDDAFIGMTRIYEFDAKDKRLSIGHTWYIPPVWGKVYNKECKLLLLEYAFEVLHFHRAELRVAGQNIRSQKAVEKIGAVKEGVLRKWGYRNDGSLRDAVIYSIIDEEWPSKKEQLLRLIAEAVR